MSKLHKLLIAVAVIVVAVVAVTLNAKSNKMVINNETIKIGVSTALTGGDVAIWGQSAMAGIQLATNEINDVGGINGRKIELVVEDDKASAQDSVGAFNKLINIDRVAAIIVATGSGATSSAVPVAQNNNIPTMVTIGSAPSITGVGDYIFRVVPADSAQGKFAANFVAKELNKNNVAILYTKNAWGEGLDGEFKKEFLTAGGKIVYENSILETDEDLRSELLKIKNSGAEVIYFPSYPKNALAGLKQMKELGIDLTVVGGDAIDGTDVLKNSAAEGFVYTLPKLGSPEEFLKRINSLKGFESLKPNIAASVSYDGAKVLFAAIAKAGTDATRIKSELAKTNYQGISNPIIEFNSNREIKSPTFEARIIKDKQAVSYQQ